MKPIEPREIRSLEDYSIDRDEFRRRIMAIKERRRVAVGDHLTFLFENRDTMIYQVQEMLRAEQIREPRAIAAELDAYNELVAGENELKATLLIEFGDPRQRDEWLRRLIGLERHVKLEVTGHAPVAALFDTRQMNAERISSVHYLTFELGSEIASAFHAGASIRLRVTHPQMQVDTTLSAVQTAALAEDLATE